MIAAYEICCWKPRYSGISVLTFINDATATILILMKKMPFQYLKSYLLSEVLCRQKQSLSQEPKQQKLN